VHIRARILMSTDRESDAERFATLARESLRAKDADGNLYLCPVCSDTMLLLGNTRSVWR
jgi:hypothetical protein